MAIPITKDEYEKRFGVTPEQTPQPKVSYFDRVKQAFQGGVDQVKQGFAQAQAGQGQGFVKSNYAGISGGLKAASGVINAASSPFAPVMEDTVGKGINYAADKISNVPAVQKFADSRAGQATSRVAEDVGNLANVAGTVAGFRAAPQVAKPVTTAIGKGTRGMRDAAGGVGTTLREVIPTKERVINSQVPKALDLTAGDVKNISLSTGNEPGTWLANKNLIGKNVDETASNVKGFYDTQYKTVRAEIEAVPNQYRGSQVPRYTDALNAIKRKIDRVPGLEEKAVEVDRLLSKGKQGKASLSDVQRTKELMDEHFNLYKTTGEVADEVQKQGLANIRKDLKTFIEDQVEDTGGASIRDLNNDVMTARDLMDAIEARSTRGLTRSNLRMGDFGAFGLGTTMGLGLGPMAPVAGIAAVFIKKLAESPSVQLRLSKYLDTLSDAKKARIKSDLEAGNIPGEFEPFVRKGTVGPTMLNIKDLVSHEGAPDLDRVGMYRSQINRGDRVEPLKVIREADGRYGIEDGKHRYEAYRQEGINKIPVQIIKGRTKVNNYQKGKPPTPTRGGDGKFTGSKATK